jgi:hypothetical protein
MYVWRLGMRTTFHPPLSMYTPCEKIQNWAIVKVTFHEQSRSCLTLLTMPYTTYYYYTHCY